MFQLIDDGFCPFQYAGWISATRDGRQEPDVGEHGETAANAGMMIEARGTKMREEITQSVLGAVPVRLGDAEK